MYVHAPALEAAAPIVFMAWLLACLQWHYVNIKSQNKEISTYIHIHVERTLVSAVRFLSFRKECNYDVGNGQALPVNCLAPRLAEICSAYLLFRSKTYSRTSETEQKIKITFFGHSA